MPCKKKLVKADSVEAIPGYSSAPILQLGQFKHEKPVIEHIHVREDDET